MPRSGRIVIPGIPHHVTHRGNRGQEVFARDDDRIDYLHLAQKEFAEADLKICAYCLMPNHVHFVVVPGSENSLAAAMGPLQTQHSHRMNVETGSRGHLWEGRYYSCPCDDAHFWRAMLYVERNPVRCGMIDLAERYRWSSAPGHCGLCNDPLLWTDWTATHINEWAEQLHAPEDAAAVRTIRGCTRSGRPAGNAEFVQTIRSRIKHL